MSEEKKVTLEQDVLVEKEGPRPRAANGVSISIPSTFRASPHPDMTSPDDKDKPDDKPSTKGALVEYKAPSVPTLVAASNSIAAFDHFWFW